MRKLYGQDWWTDLIWSWSRGSSLNDGQGDGDGTWTDGRTRSFCWRCLINNHQQQQQHWQ